MGCVDVEGVGGKEMLALWGDEDVVEEGLAVGVEWGTVSGV